MRYMYGLVVFGNGIGTKMSPLIKQILRIRDVLLLRQPSAKSARMLPERWFGCHCGLARAYEFFVQKEG